MFHFSLDVFKISSRPDPSNIDPDPKHWVKTQTVYNTYNFYDKPIYIYIFDIHITCFRKRCKKCGPIKTTRSAK